MPKTNKTTPQVDEDGRFTTAIPKGLAESYDLEDKKLVWKVDSGSALRVEVKDDEQ